MRKSKGTVFMIVIGGVAAAAVLALLIGLLVQALWNALMPEIFGLPEVSYWQSVGLLILGHLLFGGGFRHERRTRRLRSRIECPETNVQAETGAPAGV